MSVDINLFIEYQLATTNGGLLDKIAWKNKQKNFSIGESSSPNQ